MLFDNFKEFSTNIALISENGDELTYGELQNKVNEIKLNLLGTKKLVFIESSNNVVSLLYYVACMQLGHPVLLLNIESETQNLQLINHYQPNIVINTRNNEAIVKVINEQEVLFHDELCLLLATSGSTGSPKLVKLSKNNIESNTLAICSYLKLSNEDRCITSLKFNYSYGLSLINTHLYVGASIVLTEKSITESKFWQLFESSKVTSFSGVPYSFELIEKQKIKLYEFKALRYVTQAGGKLTPNLIKKNVLQARTVEVEFFVMYGQTEAGPRISYLPPKYAAEYPDFIGVALNNGELSLIDENNNVVEDIGIEGELIYKGPNVMMGYALDRSEFIGIDNTNWLKTGDLAIRNELGLYKIVGRNSRFVKPYGIRVSLDDIEMYLADKGLINAVTAVNETIYILLQKDDAIAVNFDELLAEMVTLYKLTLESFILDVIENIPKLSNGKVDYQGIKSLLIKKEKKANFWSRFLTNFTKDFSKNLMIGKAKNLSVVSIYTEEFINKNFTLSSSFTSLSGDSLSYVIISTELEQYLGYLPQDWHLKTIAELEGLKQETGM